MDVTTYVQVMPARLPRLSNISNTIVILLVVFFYGSLSADYHLQVDGLTLSRKKKKQ